MKTPDQKSEIVHSKLIELGSGLAALGIAISTPDEFTPENHQGFGNAVICLGRVALQLAEDLDQLTRERKNGGAA